MASLLKLPLQNVETIRSAVTALPPLPDSQVLVPNSVTGPAVADAGTMRQALIGFAERFAPLEEAARTRGVWRSHESAWPQVSGNGLTVRVGSGLPSEALIPFSAVWPVIEESVSPVDPAADALKIAIASYIKNDTAAAGAALDEILKRHPEHPRALFYKARILHQKNKLPEALRFYARAVALNPASSEYCGYLAMALSNSGRNDEALVMFHRAVELNPRSSEWVFYLGVQYYGVSRLAEARYYLKASIKLFPHNLSAYRYLADVYEKIGQPLDALEVLKKSLTVLPANAYARERTAAIYFKLGWHAKALAAYDELIESDPKKAASYLAGKGGCYEALGEFENAYGAYAKSFELDPSSWATKSKLQTLTIRFLKVYENQIATNPQDAAARDKLARTYLQLGGWQGAYAQYLELIAIDAAMAMRLWTDMTSLFPGLKTRLAIEA